MSEEKKNKIKIKDVNNNGKVDMADVIAWSLVTGANVLSLVCKIIFF